ncbi:MAG: DUF4293 domain-containing protein [Bacteroidales bacterium]|nr:DUF4293 domain-containing protein [Bacteroidales bacterium]MBN2758557.1 DUF4293 domain-containing protein [Bacteroidales bacterium]
MIQRIQTIFLLASLILIFLIFWFPLAGLIVDDSYQFLFRYRGIYEIHSELIAISSLPLAILFAIILILNLISIFLYKNRILQMRISILNILLMIGSVGLIYFYIWIAKTELNVIPRYTLISIFPFISAILTYLAFRAINKDQKLVKSLDRIR